MKMRKVKVFLLSCLAFLGVMFGSVLMGANVVTSNAAVLTSTEYGTDGASVRIYKRTTETNYLPIEQKESGIR